MSDLVWEPAEGEPMLLMTSGDLDRAREQMDSRRLEREWATLCGAPEVNRIVLMPGADDVLLIVSLRRLPMPSVRRFQGPMASVVASALEFLDEHRTTCKGAGAVVEGGRTRSTPGAQNEGTSRLSAPLPDRVSPPD